ncbi:hypothetical protein LCGC14_0466470 [marine sediment metagenome]|uniref:Lysozyme n=1 Tax=marine sediment metagenome TaxID=412755 RepID=A0A0F9SWH9_9ZZZZ
MSQIVEGELKVRDTSHWNGPLTDVQAFVDNQNRGLILKATQGLWTDPQFEYNGWQALDNGIPLGAYCYLDPRYGGEAQAVYFRNVCRDVFGLDKFKLGNWQDCEEPGLSVKQMRDAMFTSRDLFVLTGMYTNPGSLNPYGVLEWLSDFYLWNANWPYYPEYEHKPPLTQSPYIPYTWSKTGREDKCVLWQYEGQPNNEAKSNGFVHAHHLDRGRFIKNMRAGTAQEFAEFFGLDSAEPPKPTIPDCIVVTSRRLSMRVIPTIRNNTPFAQAFEGSQWLTAGEVAVDEYDRQWIKIKCPTAWIARWLTKNL